MSNVIEWSDDVSPSIQTTINEYWRTVETREDLQGAWADLQTQLAIDRTVNPLMHDATRKWAEGEMQALAKKRGIDRESLKDINGAAERPAQGEGVMSKDNIACLVDSAAAQDPKTGLQLEDFVGYMPMHNYIFKPTRDTWPGSSVNARIPPVPLLKSDGAPDLDEKGKQKILLASAWLDKNAPVEQATWVPGKPMIIPGKIISQGGWVDAPDCTIFNLYRPPSVVLKSGDVSLWLDHIQKLYPEHSERIISWLAHRVQRPWEKINHALVFLGAQGIGKDTLLEPIKTAIGPWNFAEVNPMQVLGRFNAFLKSVILRISEARHVGDYDRYALYDHLKAVIAAPPDVLLVDEKHLHEHRVPNITGVIITANDKQNGIYLPADDRRHLVLWSPLTKDDFNEEYWNRLYAWYGAGGNEAVAYHLANLDISAFNPKAPPPKTQAFWEIVDASRSPEDAEFADTLDALDNPKAITLVQLRNNTNSSDFAEWLKDRKNSRKIPHRMEACGYEPLRNGGATDGLWKIGGKRQVIYVKRELNEHDRLRAAEELSAGGGR